MGGRVVYCAGLENRSRREVTVGSNPTPSGGLTLEVGCRGCVCS